MNQTDMLRKIIDIDSSALSAQVRLAKEHLSAQADSDRKWFDLRIDEMREEVREINRKLDRLMK